MPPGRKQAVELDRRREKVADLYLRGYRQQQIADQLGLTQATISNDLKAARRMWQERAAAHVQEIVNRELDRIDQLERTYWEAWQRSLLKKTRRTIKPVPVSKQSNETVNKEVERTVEQSCGDPRFLQGIEWCIDARCKLLGVAKPDANQSPAGERPYLVVEGIDAGLATGTKLAGQTTGADGGEVIEGKLALPPADENQGGKQP